MRVFIGGVGYRNRRDHSCGAVIVDALARSLPSSHVTVAEISYDPIAVVQRVRGDLPDPFDLAILVGAAERPQRKPGTLSVYRWDRVMPSPAAIQAAITAALTGVIALDNMLVIAQHFRVLPPTVVVVEIEPNAPEFGDTLTPSVQAATARACEIITTLAADPAGASLIPRGPLDANRPPTPGFISARAYDVVY